MKVRGRKPEPRAPKWWRAWRRWRIRPEPKRQYRLFGGPFDGGKVWLTEPGTTMVFTCKGRRGRYEGTGPNFQTSHWVGD